jgi:hypothetical protein
MRVLYVCVCTWLNRFDEGSCMKKKKTKTQWSGNAHKWRWRRRRNIIIILTCGGDAAPKRCWLTAGREWLRRWQKKSVWGLFCAVTAAAADTDISSGPAAAAVDVYNAYTHAFAHTHTYTHTHTRTHVYTCIRTRTKIYVYCVKYVFIIMRAQ